MERVLRCHGERSNAIMRKAERVIKCQKFVFEWWDNERSRKSVVKGHKGS
jgi:hypothetical protein